MNVARDATQARLELGAWSLSLTRRSLIARDGPERSDVSKLSIQGPTENQKAVRITLQKTLQFV